MKKILIAVLAIGAMAACTKSKVLLEQPGEISFQPVAQKATKAAVDGTTYPTGDAYNFKVWAWWGDQEAGKDIDNFTGTTPYIVAGEFKNKGGNSWGGKTPYYWPSQGSLVFAGYSPASATGKFAYNLQEKRFSVEGYVQSSNISQTNDLMWFDVTDKSYDQNGSDGKGVPVIFKHALSWLTFKFNLNNETTPENWEVTKVELNGIETKGNFTATLWEELSETVENMTIYSGKHTVKYSSAPTALESTPNGIVVIPQSCAPAKPAEGETASVPAAAELVITYNLKTSNNGVLDGQEVKLELNGKNNAFEMWEPGKHYIYTITFGGNEILIAPSVTDWNDVTVDYIPVQ